MESGEWQSTAAKCWTKKTNIKFQISTLSTGIWDLKLEFLKNGIKKI